MSGLRHLDLDLLFTKAGTTYQAMITRSPAGDGQLVTFGAVLSDLELENFVLKVGRFRSRTRRVDTAPVGAAKQLGGQLFDAVFAGPVRECLRRSLDQADREHAALRIRLLLSGCPDLADLPWELLYDREDDSFLALSDRTPVVRYVQLPNPPRAIPVTLPLRILVVRSEPSDYPPLNLATEWTQVAGALGGLADAGELALTELAAPTLGELRRALVRDTFHVLHYMGHGGFDAQLGGLLMFTDQAGRSAPVTSGDLGVILRDHTSLRLAVLNACEAGRTDPADPFAGVADMLVRRGIPAVVAMQFEVSDTAAVEFAPALYGALAAGRPVDAAVAEARKAMFTVSPLEWATPVLYLRTEDDARLFAISRDPQQVPGRPVRPDAGIPDAPAGADGTPQRLNLSAAPGSPAVTAGEAIRPDPPPAGPGNGQAAGASAAPRVPAAQSGPPSHPTVRRWPRLAAIAALVGVTAAIAAFTINIVLSGGGDPAACPGSTQPGLHQVTRTGSAGSGLVICPVQVDHGKSPGLNSVLSGRIVGQLPAGKSIIVVSQPDPGSCATDGTRGTGGYYLIGQVHQDSRGDYTVTSGNYYSGAQTIQRDFYYLLGPESAVAGFSGDGTSWPGLASFTGFQSLGSFTFTPVQPANHYCSG
jgi:CHAT domain